MIRIKNPHSRRSEQSKVALIQKDKSKPEIQYLQCLRLQKALIQKDQRKFVEVQFLP